METLKRCPFCKNPPSSKDVNQDEVWCSNSRCKIYNIHMSKNEWQIRPIEESKEEEILTLKRDLQRNKNSFIEELNNAYSLMKELKNKSSILQKKYDSLVSDIETARTSLENSKKTSAILQEKFDVYKRDSSKEIGTLQIKLEDERKAALYYKESAQNSINSFTVLQNKYDTLQKKYDGLVFDMEATKASFLKTKGEYSVLEQSFDRYRNDTARANSDLRKRLNDEIKINEDYKNNTGKRILLIEETLQKKYNVLKEKYDSLVSDMKTTKMSLLKVNGEYNDLKKTFDSFKSSSIKANNDLQNLLNDERKASSHYKEKAEERISTLEKTLEKIYDGSSDVLKSPRSK